MRTSEARPPHRAAWWIPLALACAGSAAFALLWPPIGWWPLAFFVLTPVLLAALLARTTRGAAAALFLAFLPSWFWLELWIRELTPLGFSAMVAFLSLYAALFGVLVRVVDRRTNRRLPLAFLAPVLWCTVELLRTRWILGGYPWFELGNALIGGAESEGLFARSAALSGVMLPTAVAACTAGGAADLLLYGRRGTRTTALAGGALALLVFLANLGYGLLSLRGRAAEAERSVTILVVQTNLSASNKRRWSQEEQLRDVSGFLELTARGILDTRSRGGEPALIVWPETTIPGFGFEAETIATLEQGGFYPGRLYLSALEDLREAAGRPILVGCATALGLRVDPEEGGRWLWDRYYNSAYLLDGAAPMTRYDKMHLTPFGEEMPLFSRWDWLERRMLALGAPGMQFNLDAGERPVRFEIRALDGRPVRFATPICFEDTLADVCRRLAYDEGRRDVDLLINLSNDGWFGSSDAGRAQHVLHARLRAIELDLPLLRCANTGMSVLIERTGRVSAWIGPEAPGQGRVADTLAAEVSLAPGGTFFGRRGDIGSPIALALAALLLLNGLRGRRKEEAVR